MEIKSISYPSPLSEIEDIENDNIDVFVELEDGTKFTLVVTTPQNILWYMNKENKDFVEAGPPDIIVKSLTKENIRDAIKTYAADNGYWLKVYYLIGLGEDGFENKDLDHKIKTIMEKFK